MKSQLRRSWDFNRSREGKSLPEEIIQQGKIEAQLRNSGQIEQSDVHELRAHQEGKGKTSLGEPTEQFGMAGDEFVNRRLERRLRGAPVLLLQEGDELFHRGSLRRGKL